MKTVALMFLLTAATALSLRAQTYQQVAPQTPQAGAPGGLPAPAPAAAPAQPRTVIVPVLRGLVFLSSPSQLRREGVKTPGLNLKSVSRLDTPAYRKTLSAYLGKPVTLADLRTITNAAIVALRAADRPVTEVLVPEQNVQGGVIQILVIEGRLGAVKVEGNRWFDSGFLASQIRTQSGQVIAGSTLQGDLAWLNQNPFRHVDGVFAQGDQPGETDLILKTQDERPVRLYTGWDTTGTAITNENRLFAGLNWGNAFGYDDQLNYQFTASPDFREMLAQSFSYVAPLPWRDTLTVFGSYATSRPDIPDFTLKGISWQLGLRYSTPLPTIGQMTENLVYGLDVKNSNNNLAFGGAQVFAQSTDIAELSIGYNASLADKFGLTNASATIYGNPGGLGGDDDNADYQASRSGAKTDFAYGTLTITRDTRLPVGFVWHLDATGQLATGPLLGSEQLGFGGEDSVRGYEEREVNGDSGVVVQDELRTPSIDLKRGGYLTPFVFFDWGVAVTSEPLAGEPKNTSLAGTGLGVRYQLLSNVVASTDYGWQLKESGVSPTDDTGRWDASVTLAW